MNKQQRGYTLIELMVSLLLGLMLISGFGSLFTQSQKNATVQRSLSYMTDDGRYILELFGRELRRAGSLRNRYDVSNGGIPEMIFTADLTDPADTNVLDSTLSFTAGDYIRGEYNVGGFGATADPHNINRLALRYQLMNNSELAPIDLSSSNSPCERQILLTQGEVDDAAGTPPIEFPSTQVHLVTLYFYVAPDELNIPTLYCRANRRNRNPIDNTTAHNVTSDASGEPLISNVEKLVISYGIDTDIGTGTDENKAANYYATADSVFDWQKVVSAKLSVVLRSDEDHLTQNKVPYTVDGTKTTPNDHRLYKVFSTTIAFRNAF